MTPTHYMAKIAPIGILYSGSLVCSNTAYMYLNVGFIQMLKVCPPRYPTSPAIYLHGPTLIQLSGIR